jgi:NADH:ubiquinone oxidoreductase subunit 6 (subunit J)
MNPVMSQYLPPELLVYGGFLFAAFLACGGAVVAVLPWNIIYSVFGLVACLTGVAGLYIFLGSEFVALMQLLIYVGAICITIVFAVMLSLPAKAPKTPRSRLKILAAGGASILVFVAFCLMVFRTPWVVAAGRIGDWSVRRLGTMLLTRFELVFEVISLVLLLAVVGAVITAALPNGEGRRKPVTPGSAEGGS